MQLTKDERRAVCVHEAGHAIIHALGGNFVYRVAVAPEGATGWTCEARKGSVLTDLWGMCEPSDLSTPLMFMEWDENEWAYRTDRAGFTAMFKGFGRQAIGRGMQVKTLAGARNGLRRALFGALAGPIAEAIHLSMDAWELIDPFNAHDEFDDISKAAAFSRLLPWRNEYDRAAELTEQTLRRPEVWAMVVRLADELERVGSIEEGIEAFLPAAVPNWPPSPRARQCIPFQCTPLECPPEQDGTA